VEHLILFDQALTGRDLGIACATAVPVGVADGKLTLGEESQPTTQVRLQSLEDLAHQGVCLRGVAQFCELDRRVAAGRAAPPFAICWWRPKNSMSCLRGRPISKLRAPMQAASGARSRAPALRRSRWPGILAF
jgi:hypothetical protein